MEIIEAVWEKRNLGVECQELNIGKNDSLDQVKETLGKLNKEYQVVKLPKGRADVAFYLQSQGYYYIENNIEMSRDLKNLDFEKPFNKLVGKFNYYEASEEETQTILKHIKEDNMFDTDKVALDPFFSKNQSGHRFSCWTNEIRGDKVKLYNVNVAEKNIGFFVLRQTGEKKYDSFLAGAYEPYREIYGSTTIMAPILEAAKRGGKVIEAATSTNNMGSLRVHFGLGYHITEIYTIFVKHL